MLHLLASEGAAAGAAIGGFFIFWLILAVAALALWIWALVDIIGRPMDGTKKLLWIIVILVAPLLGALLYLLIGRKV